MAKGLFDTELKQLDGLLKKVRDKALERLGQKAEKLPDSFDAERFEAEPRQYAYEAQISIQAEWGGIMSQVIHRPWIG